MRKYNTILFDLDGTLLNTLEDLTDSTNYTLGQYGLPVRSIEEVRRFVGNGIHKLILRAVPEGTSEETTEQVFSCFKAYYTEHCNCKTAPYPGIMELLGKLQKAGYGMAVVSNKAHEAVTELQKLYFQDVIPVAIGEQEILGIHKKPAPDMVRRAMEQLGSSPERTLYVGDSEVDWETAKNAGLDCMLVTWGFRDRGVLKALKPEWIADNTEEAWEWISGENEK